MWGKKREKSAIHEELTKAQQHLDRANTMAEEVQSRRGRVDSLASTASARSKRNGFGEDYAITLVLRKA